MNKEVEERFDLNIGYLCTGHQCRLGRSQMLAMRWLGTRGETVDYSYSELDCASSRFANVLRGLGCVGGETLFTFLPKIPAQYIVLLGSLKQRLVTGPLFVNFGQEALLDRLADAQAQIVVTRKSGWSKLQPIRRLLTSLRYVLLVDAEEHLDGEVLSYNLLMSQATADFTVPQTSPDTPSILHYTSGSTGKPKGALHRHGSFEYQLRTGGEVLHLSPGDIYWCTADPGWVTGTTYGMIVPWSLGVAQIHFGGGFEAGKWFEVLEKEKVKIWYTAPTALRMLMREDARLFRQFDLSRLQYIFSVGEPLNPEVILWGERVLGKAIHDTWFQTETGAIMIANRPGLPIMPGSMGKPVAGIEPGILDDQGEPVPDGTEGHLCLKTGWGSMFTAYLNNPAVYEGKFRKGWYWTGDMARRDDQGFYWFLGRSDDVINTAGHLVSPFEVESALLEIPEIAESAVIGAPDELLFEKVIAFVSLRAGVEWNRPLELKIRLHVSNKVSTTATPQELLVMEAIPKNKSGKIMRRLLKARYLGLEVGDISTLEI